MKNPFPPELQHYRLSPPKHASLVGGFRFSDTWCGVFVSEYEFNDITRWIAFAKSVEGLHTAPRIFHSVSLGVMSLDENEHRSVNRFDTNSQALEVRDAILAVTPTWIGDAEPVIEAAHSLMTCVFLENMLQDEGERRNELLEAVQAKVSDTPATKHH